MQNKILPYEKNIKYFSIKQLGFVVSKKGFAFS